MTKLTQQMAKGAIKEAEKIKKEFTARTLKLVTSGFGLVAALAWNEVIKEAVEVYVKPIFGQGSGLLSLFIYALVVTTLLVIISYQLSKLGGNTKEDRVD